MLKNKNILKVISILLVMVMSMCMLTGCGLKNEENSNNNDGNNNSSQEDKSYEEPIKNLVEGLGEANAEKFLNAFPNFISDQIKEIFTDDVLKETLESVKPEYGDNITMSYKATNASEISEEDINNMKTEVNSMYEVEANITKGYKVDVEITTKGDTKETTDNDSFEVYEVDGKWSLIQFQ